MSPNIATDAHRFQNQLRIMFGIDRHELVEFGVLVYDDVEGWIAFRSNPYLATMHHVEPRMEKLYALIESRQPKPADEALGKERP